MELPHEACDRCLNSISGGRVVNRSTGKRQDPSLSLAASQEGVVARRQLLEAGMSADMIDRRLQTDWFTPVHRGVYRIGPVSGPWWREAAAILACGACSAISHVSAAVMRQIVGSRAMDDHVDVICTRSDHAARVGLRVRRLRTLRPDEVAMLHGLPVTTAPRTLLDLAAVLPPRRLEQALAEAFATAASSEAAVKRMVERHPRQKGVGALRALLGQDEPALARSEAEERALALVIRAGLPRPRCNVRVLGYRVDFLWPRERLVVEVDGFAAHSSRQRFERDRARDTALVAAGYRVIRVTWRKLCDEPEKVAVQIAQALVSVR